MNNRKAKQLRRNAMNDLFNWYLTLLEEDQRGELTKEQAIQYTPVVRYWSEHHERKDKDGNEYVSIQYHVSDHTQRWFIKQEKRNYGKCCESTISRW